MSFSGFMTCYSSSDALSAVSGEEAVKDEAWALE
jgi:hypothetical protein